MKAPPDDLAFFSLFEVEPTLIDPDAPWIYNTATYQTERDGYQVKLEISPSYSSLKATLTFEGREIAEAEVTSFTGLEIDMDGGREALVVRFGDADASAVVLTLKPHVRLTMIASSDC